MRAGDELMHSSIAEEGCQPMVAETKLAHIEGGTNAEPASCKFALDGEQLADAGLAGMQLACELSPSVRGESGPFNPMQIMVSQYDNGQVCNQLGGQRFAQSTGDSQADLVAIGNQLSLAVTPPPLQLQAGDGVEAEIASLELNKYERSRSADMREAPESNHKNHEPNKMLAANQLGRVDRSHSCDPTPSIVVHWNPETGGLDSQLAASNKRVLASEQLLSTIMDRPNNDGETALSFPRKNLAGSQGSGLSIMAIPSQVRKHSMALLSTITTRSGQTLRRLSMVASHPVESLFNRSKSREGDPTENTASDDQEAQTRGQAKKVKNRPLSHCNSKKTFDDYLMAVAGIDSSSDENEHSVDDDEDLSEDEDSINYSLLLGRNLLRNCEPAKELTSKGVQVKESTCDYVRASQRDLCEVDKPPETIDTGVQHASLETVAAFKPSNAKQAASAFELPSALQRQGGYYERSTSRTGTSTKNRSHELSIDMKISDNGTRETDSAGGILGKPPIGLAKIRSPRRRAAKRTSRWHAKRLRAETKAAKTVAIIIGGFIFCWLPFFTAYLSRVIICEKPDCIPQSLLSLFIWLGYLNSAINPVIYGLFSADFRHAFKNILCGCRLRNTDDTVVVSVLVDNIIKSIL